MLQLLKARTNTELLPSSKSTKFQTTTQLYAMHITHPMP